ncbi:thioredoxin family protein [Myxococcus landrumensis]|uniref:Thioredoxin family protein n=1 Tax=Myxococcus landrumensis TaxID=2813577 RepID=A0ABX7N291_9BACT|nr:thioredoxin family protein [Myxococcus landrumus]QSQ12549.1 thioredoxin family protein [Myxococcus landrumus]
MRTYSGCLLLLGLVACTTANTGVRDRVEQARAAEPLPFIQDDYARALAEAKARGVPLFVLATTGWCISCRSMKAHVLSSPSLGRHADRFVWLEVSTDSSQNVAFQQKYPIESYPKLFILDPREEKALLRFNDTLTVAELEQLLEDGERAYKGGAKGVEALLVQADALFAQGRVVEASKVLTEVLATAPADWSRRGRVALALVESFYETYELRGLEDCATKALELLPGASRSLAWSHVARRGLACAQSILPKELEPKRAEFLQNALEEKVAEAMGPPSIDMSVDDRSWLYSGRVWMRQMAKDEAGEKALAEEWLTFLETEAAKAPTPWARAILDPHRADAALQLKTPERAIPALEQSEKEFPQDYVVPLRLSQLYQAQGRMEDALAATDRALVDAQGPRRVSVMGIRALILKERKDTAIAAKALRDAIAYSESLPEVQRSMCSVSRLKRELAQLEAPPQVTPPK